jgi:hypothetical protein
MNNNLTIATTANTLTFSRAFTVPAGGLILTITGTGTVAFSAASNPLTVNSGSSLYMSGGETVTVTNPVFQAGSVARYDGSVGTPLVKAWTYSILKLEGSSKTFNFAAGQT